MPCIGCRPVNEPQIVRAQFQRRICKHGMVITLFRTFALSKVIEKAARLSCLIQQYFSSFSVCGEPVLTGKTSKALIKRTREDRAPCWMVQVRSADRWH